MIFQILATVFGDKFLLTKPYIWALHLPSFGVFISDDLAEMLINVGRFYRNRPNDPSETVKIQIMVGCQCSDSAWQHHAGRSLLSENNT